MGDFIELEFDLNNCRDRGDNEVGCYERQGRTIGNLEVKSYSFLTYKSTTRLLGLSLETFHVNISYHHKSQIRSMRMEYSIPNDCLFN